MLKIILPVTIGLGMILLFAIGGIAIFGSKIRGSGQGIPVRIHTVERGDLIESVTAPGEIAPRTDVAISARVSARIELLPFREGQRVRKGDLLVKLDSAYLDAALLAAEARRAAQAEQIEVQREQIESQKDRIIRIEISLAQAERDLARKQTLLESSDVAESIVDEVQSRVDEFKADIDAAQHTLKASERTQLVHRHNLEVADAEVTSARENLTYTTILSPIVGVVTQVNAEVGELVVTGTMNNPGTVILTVADLLQMVVKAEVDETDVGDIRKGQHVLVRINAYPDRVFEGEVISVALNATRSSTKYFETEILLEDTGQRIHSGLTADADIAIQRHTAVMKLPSQAVLGRPVDDLPAEIREGHADVDETKTIATVVYRFVDGKAVVTPVVIGPSDMTHTVIMSGVAAGDRVIVGPYKVLENIKHEQNIQDEKAKDNGSERDSDTCSKAKDSGDKSAADVANLPPDDDALKTDVSD